MSVRRILTTDEFNAVSDLAVHRSYRVALKLIAQMCPLDDSPETLWTHTFTYEQQIALLAIGAQIVGDIDNAF